MNLLGVVYIHYVKVVCYVVKGCQPALELHTEFTEDVKFIEGLYNGVV